MVKCKIGDLDDHEYKLNQDNSTVTHDYHDDYHRSAFTCKQCGITIIKYYFRGDCQWKALSPTGDVLFDDYPDLPKD